MDKVPKRGAGAWPEWENQFLVLSGGRPGFFADPHIILFASLHTCQKKRSHSIEFSNK